VSSTNYGVKKKRKKGITLSSQRGKKRSDADEMNHRKEER
jgi:hypothetical protein